MFDSLQNGLRDAFKSLAGRGKLTEANMRDGLAIIERSLLEADVSYSVVQDFMAHVGEQALGERVLGSLRPHEQLIGIVHQELIDVLGPVDPSLHLRGEITVIMLCGLQGSGKTTTCGKLARLIQQHGKKPFLAAADLQRPAAIDQLHVLGERLGVGVYSDRTLKDPVKVCRDAVAKAKAEKADVVILDTAGRLAIDEELMAELRLIDNRLQPDQVYLVVDGMTGQDAVNSAQAFNDALELDGAIMTKLDGDARGGALLSVKHVTGVPIKFIGTGEALDALEPFHPDRMAGRILGQGDVLTLFETAQREFDQEQMAKTEERLKQGQFTLEDFRAQMAQIARPGLMQKMLKMMPGMPSMPEVSEKDLSRLFGVIDAMTPGERQNPTIIDPSRRNRIAKGAGVQTSEVNDLVKQFGAMKQLMESMAGKGVGERMKMARQLQENGLFNPGGRLAKQKQSGSGGLSATQRAKLKARRKADKRKKGGKKRK
ncbi:MAG: signal recognition particle protein [Planctomycetales bacterium]|nr:signal recognition particle protein [Planctomycetales bacterium]